MRKQNGPLPATFLCRLRELETSYLQSDDPIRQSGFGGGPQRWRAERGPILNAVQGDGDFLDVGCANGYLLECLVAWAAESGIRLIPHGVDIGPRLIAAARARLRQHAANFTVANGWEWRPARRVRYVYTLHDCVPPDFLASYVSHLLGAAVEPGGRLIVGAYGSRSDSVLAPDLGVVLRDMGFGVRGPCRAGEPPINSFAWIDAPVPPR